MKKLRLKIKNRLHFLENDIGKRFTTVFLALHLEYKRMKEYYTIGGNKMTKEYIMSIDQGTTSSRAIIFDKAGNPKWSSQKSLRNIFLSQAG